MTPTGRGRLLSVLAGAATLVLACAIPAAAQDGKLPRPFSLRVIQSGHSLTDPIPEPLAVMVRSMGEQSPVIARSTIPGSPMDWRWNNATTPNARTDMAKYDMLVLTERASLSNTLPWHNSEKMALQWFNLAQSDGNGGKGAETILYATWVDIDSGPGHPNPHKDPEAHIPFRQRLPLEMARWEQIADYVNANKPAAAPKMRVIPSPLVMAAIYDAIALGEVPDITNIKELFTDNIHLNPTGAYLIALAHYAVIYGRDPRELPDRIGGRDPRPELAAYMQELVWKVVKAYPRAGLGGVG